MSNLFKGAEIEQIHIEPYELREMSGEHVPGPIPPPVFRGLNEEGSDSEEERRSEAPHREEEPGGRERIDRIEKEAYEKAFKLGEAAGAERGERMFRSAIETFLKAAEELRRVEQAIYRRVEGDILDLVLATTRKVVGKEVDSDREMILGVLRDAIAKVIDRERVRVRINPSDFDFVQAHRSEIVRAIDGIKHLLIEKDEGVSRGGAVVETDHGTIDSTLERRFAEVEKALRHEAPEKRHGPMWRETKAPEGEPPG